MAERPASERHEWQVFAALESAARWPAVYIDDMQKVLDRYQPAG